MAAAADPGDVAIAPTAERRLPTRPLLLRGRPSERGAALLEFALVVPLLIAFLVAIVSGGIAIGQSVSLNNAAREATRYGSVLSVDGDVDGWLHRVADVAISSASGDLSPTTGGQRVCVAYVHPAGTETDDRTVRLVESGGVRTIGNGQTCLVDDGRPDTERRVQVAVQRDSHFDAFVFSTAVTLEGHSVARYERVDR